MRSLRWFVHGSLLLTLSACSTYYQKYAKFHTLFLSNRLEEADALLADDRKAGRSKTRLLHYLDRGVVAHLMGRYEDSNFFLEQACITHESFLKDYFEEGLAFLINPLVTDYRGEDHEVLLLHYYKALNFLQLGQYDAALVECHRMNAKLNQMNGKYDGDQKYKRDALIHTLMGLIYQANHDYNNAYIAYRNALEIYQNDYRQLFGQVVPEQLKRDLIYTAYKMGFADQVAYYKRLFGLAYDPAQKTAESDVVFLWNNGLGPVKQKWELDFVIVRGIGGTICFENKNLGLLLPFPLPPDGDKIEALLGMKFVCIAFPEYQERRLKYTQAMVTTACGQKRQLELVEDVNAISFQILEQRMMLELGKSLLRLALKKAIEYEIHKKNAVLEIIVSSINFVTEQADTRNWQTLPHSIYYTRLRLPEGMQTLQFQASSAYTLHRDRQEFCLRLCKGRTAFQIVHSPYTIDY